MDIKQYVAKLAELADPTPENLAALGDWCENIALPWLWVEMAGAILEPKQRHPQARTEPTPPKLRPLSDQDTVRSGLMVSAADQDQMVHKSTYYQAQLTMLDSVAKIYCRQIRTVFEQWQPGSPHVFALDVAVDELHTALHEYMSYARILLEDAGTYVTQVSGYYGAWRSAVDHPFQIYVGTRQATFGKFSGLTHTDRTPYVPIAVLRTAIEIRLRNAFCINGFINQKTGETVPIDMNRLLTAISTQKDKLDFAVDLHDIWRIYRWSNFYLHVGLRDFPWVTPFLCQFLHPIFTNARADGTKTGNMDGGIRLSRPTWEAVRESIREQARPHGFWTRIADAWRALWPKGSCLALPDYEGRTPACEFTK